MSSKIEYMKINNIIDKYISKLKEGRNFLIINLINVKYVLEYLKSMCTR